MPQARSIEGNDLFFPRYRISCNEMGSNRNGSRRLRLLESVRQFSPNSINSCKATTGASYNT